MTMRNFVSATSVAALMLASLLQPALCFTIPSNTKIATRTTWSSINAKISSDDDSNNDQIYISGGDDTRRGFFQKVSIIALGGSIATFRPEEASALPLVTVTEFETILKDSAKSIQIVELSGPKSETAIVTLVDGTQFGISDLYESPVDPRSPLKLVATCRSYKVPTKFVGLADALSTTSAGSKKKKVYMNERVRIAAEKEKLKMERMAQDEAERLEELERYEG